MTCSNSNGSWGPVGGAAGRLQATHRPVGPGHFNCANWKPCLQLQLQAVASLIAADLLATQQQLLTQPLVLPLL